MLVWLVACGGNSPPAGGDDDQTGGDGGLVGGSCSAVPADETGDGTYYAADGTGNCGFDASPDDLMVVAMNHPTTATRVVRRMSRGHRSERHA